MKYLTVLILGFFLPAFSSQLSAQKKKVREVEDMVYKITMYDKRNTKKGNEDLLTIKADKINSNYLDDKHGFGTAKIILISDSTVNETEEVVETRIIKFEAETSSKDGEQVKWTVIITGYDIEGVAVVSKNDKVKREYEFSGIEKVKKVKKKKEEKE